MQNAARLIVMAYVLTGIPCCLSGMMVVIHGCAMHPLCTRDAACVRGSAPAQQLSMSS